LKPSSLDLAHILVTRSGDAGRVLTERVRALGFVALHLPLIELAPPENPQALDRALAALPSIDGVILTSAEAVRQACRLGLLSRLGDVELVVPGKGTADLLRASGFARVQWPAAGTGGSEGMLMLPTLQRVEGRHWLILAAVGGRRLLDEQLGARGALVSRLNVYRRVPLAPAPNALEALEKGESWVTLLASGGALEQLQQALPEHLWTRLCMGSMVAPSERVAAMASSRGATCVLLSTGASDDEMLAALALGPSPR
jgi:uroporphyrinogen-III synthase